jgi:hypothetical protein
VQDYFSWQASKQAMWVSGVCKHKYSIIKHLYQGIDSKILKSMTWGKAGRRPAMNKEEFKVLDWLRSIRDEHSETTKDWTPEQILQETKERALLTKREIEDLRKAKKNA